MRSAESQKRRSQPTREAVLAHQREYDLREAQTQRERQADPARRARLEEDQARIGAVLAETEQ